MQLNATASFTLVEQSIEADLLNKENAHSLCRALGEDHMPTAHIEI